MLRVEGLRFAGLSIILMAVPLAAPAQSENALVSGGPEMIIEALAAEPSDLTFVNFWATWCAPCIEELPEFVRFASDFEDSGARVALVTVDSDEDAGAAAAFLRKAGWSGASFIKSGKDHEFVAGFQSDWNGAVPATLVYDREMNLLDSLLGQTTYVELARIARDRLTDR